jgi:hypothetical protein
MTLSNFLTTTESSITNMVNRTACEAGLCPVSHFLIQKIPLAPNNDVIEISPNPIPRKQGVPRILAAGSSRMKGYPETMR